MASSASASASASASEPSLLHILLSNARSPKSVANPRILKHLMGNEGGIGVQVYGAVVLLLDVLLLWFKMFLVYIESIYRLVVPRELKSVKGDIALITGSGHGMGKELALQYAALGAIIVCVDINEKENTRTVEEIKNTGGQAHGFVCDVSSRAKVEDLAEKVRSQVGEVSILVNNAGIMPCHSFLTHKEDEISKLFGVNVFAHFWLNQAFLPSMINRNHGHIVALSSMAGILGLNNLVPYCASKFAVRGMMEALHEELREDPRNLQIKLTCIYPYMVDTGLCQKPKIRFPSLMNLVNPKDAAQLIIEAMRRDQTEISIPSPLLVVNNICRAQPVKIGFLLKDFLDSGVESHE